ncbi:hypothetical protein [Roseovarius sp. Pro17]|uniref:hypothetical protein n=1 Tax=Roseovarius sp. Pro17 TaxID=3108175 RepID=UPI002D794DA3|nr:hypothetical protein [Roseovarius sp. Pro17]
MTAELRDSGSAGTYDTTHQSFSSVAYGKYAPSTPDYTTKFYSHLKRWRYETLTSSSADVIVKNQAFRDIVDMGDVILPLIISELRKRPDFLIVAMALITGQNPAKPSQLGDIKAMSQAWIDWYDYQR